MVEFAYNNFKNASIGNTPFELNYGYHLYVSFEDKFDVRFRSSLSKELAMELRELINICHQNLLHAQDLQKQANNKRLKLWNYTPNEKVWLNSRYIKTKKNQKLEAKYFGPFRVLHSVKK